ncbi:PP2C family serine/threonine-protein phosphatase [Planobispora siamensis]|uniref:PPM-type phosphatase domain-containing protein n=1 Tax=Planobispora siamensis TaxID=936338 RepID=A0A8J3WLA6_9ACTN|nr:protein phosphatase 2C domain-containing protein [Planobispora siamensis]GIH95074.1 hypothetical protein Psi01_57040 [Planobispora siamensis]
MTAPDDAVATPEAGVGEPDDAVTLPVAARRPAGTPETGKSPADPGDTAHAGSPTGAGSPAKAGNPAGAEDTTATGDASDPGNTTGAPEAGESPAGAGTTADTTSTTDAAGAENTSDAADTTDAAGASGVEAGAGGACPRCGSSVHPGEFFCEGCGQPLDGAGCVRCGPAPVDPEGYCELCGLRQPSESDHTETEAGGAAGVSDRGLRHSRNEDAMALVAADGVTIGVVCDGVSSSPRPETASSAAARTGATSLLEALRSGADPVTATRTALAGAATAVAALGSSVDDAPACTYVSAVVGPDRVTIGWAGDSRAYWLGAAATPPPGTGTDSDTGPMPSPISDTDTGPMLSPVSGAGPAPLRGPALLTEDDVVSPGLLSAWLGADAGRITAHVGEFAPEGPGVVLVCSDGLWGYLEEAADLAPFTARDTPLEAARALVRHALAAGGRDNVTVLVIPFHPPPV